VAGLVSRLRLMLAEPDEPEPGHWADALSVAYQQRLAWLREIRDEAEQLAAQRRRLAVGLGPLPDPAASASAAARDADLAARQHTLVELAAAVRVQLERFRAEREAILGIGDQQVAARRAREAVARWRSDSERLLGDAEHGFPEPTGYVADNGQPQAFEQPPGGQR